MNLIIFNNSITLESGMSGSDVRAIEWSKIFLFKGHQLTVVIPLEAVARFEALKGSIKIFVTTHLPVQKLGLFIGYVLRTIKTCFMVNKLSVDGIIYSSSDLMPDAIPALFLKLKNRRLRWISGMHLIAPDPFRGFKNAKANSFSFPSIRGIYYFFYQRMMVFFMKYKADLVFVSNRQDKEFLLKKGFNEGQVLVTWGGINRQPIMNLSKQEIKFDACFIGRDHPQKGVDDLLEIWQAVCKEKPDARLCLLGALDRIKNTPACSLLKNNLTFFGIVDGIKKFEIIQSAKLFICPSYYESFGIVIAEAMSVGLPVVAYDLDIYYDIYPQGMIKVPLGDKHGFANKVIELLKDEDKRSELSKQALAVSQRFSWEETAGDILKKLG
ncbi:MAG: glycosyltransferase family 4 protein [Candidatus Omnitrophota bacterium]